MTSAYNVKGTYKDVEQKEQVGEAFVETTVPGKSEGP